MTDYILMLPILLSFFVAFALLPMWIRKAKQIDLVWDDMNKYEKAKVAGSGGLIVVLAFLLGVLIFVAYRIFIINIETDLIKIFALLTVTLILAGVGFVDDLLGWRHGGLSRRSRLILVALAAIPLMAINAGVSSVILPFVGATNLGIFYALLIIPFAVVGATTTFNFLAGYNGLEAGQGIILLTAYGFVAFFLGQSWISVILWCMVAALVAFLIYNFNPAKIFPGDSMTYVIGGLLAVSAILGNFEKIALFFFIPYIIETGLKVRGKLVKHSFGKPKSDDSLEMPYNKIYGLEHLMIWIMKKKNIKATENKVVFMIWAFQILIVILGTIIFWESIFI